MIETSLKERIYRSTKLVAAIKVAAAYGINESQILAGTGLEAAKLENSEYLISVDQLVVALKNIARLKVSPTLPYEIGQSIHVSAYGMYGFAILCSRNFRETMRFAQKYHALATPINRIVFDETPGSEGWVIEPIVHPHVDEESRAFLINMQIGVHISLHRDIMGNDYFPQFITVDYSRQDYHQLPIISDCQVSFSAERNYVHVGQEWLDQTPTFGNQVTFQEVENLCQNELSNIANRPGLSGRVRTIILQSLADPKSIEQIAEVLGMSSRTLRRHLTTEKTSYRSILDETRSEVALQYLRDSSMTNDEVAYALGFADVSSFRRAFQRWTGTTTSGFRQRLI